MDRCQLYRLRIESAVKLIYSKVVPGYDKETQLWTRPETLSTRSDGMGQ